MSSTTPTEPSNWTRSPIRIGWVMARRIPAIPLASVCRAAKPTTRPSTADEASTPAAARFTAANCMSAKAIPITRMPAKTRRRGRRSRVSATAESSPWTWTKLASFAPRRASARSMASASVTVPISVSAAVSSSRWSPQKPSPRGIIAARRAAEGTELKAVLLDGMGTLLRLVPPVPALAERLGVDEPTAERAFRAEVAYYLEHQLEGSDTGTLALLRRRCADVLADAAGVPREGALEALMASLRFEPYDDAPPAVAALRDRGLRVVVVSNWDCSLGGVLAELGLGVDSVVTSAEVGACKPDPRIFEVALARAGCAPAEALHVGDSIDNDVAGARAVGIRALHLDRAGGGDISTLSALLS